METSQIAPILFKGYREVELNQAEIQALNTTPRLLVQPPGSGRTFRLINCHITIAPEGTAFAGASTAVQIAFSGGTIFTATATGFLAETLKHSTPVLETVYSGTPVLVANESLRITGANDMTLGDALAKLTVQIWYEIIPFA